MVDYSWRRQLAVTGGEDGRVRLWNPLVPQRPLAVLCGHCCRVVDVAIHETQSAILSIDGDAVRPRSLCSDAHRSVLRLVSVCMQCSEVVTTPPSYAPQSW